MRDELKIFDNLEFGRVRILVIDDEPWFVGKDVALALGYTNSRKALADHVDVEDKGVTKCDTLGGHQEMTIINESGMYALIFGSKLPSAKRFKHWVTSEVLPAIRRTGTYTYNQNIYKIKDTSLGEITSFVREMDKVMRDQNSCPYQIAEAFQGICTQFGIQLPENFVNRGYEPVNYITLEEIYNTPDVDEEEDE